MYVLNGTLHKGMFQNSTLLKNGTVQTNTV
jgi:hypothetical protein